VTLKPIREIFLVALVLLEPFTDQLLLQCEGTLGTYGWRHKQCHIHAIHFYFFKITHQMAPLFQYHIPAININFKVIRQMAP